MNILEPISKFSKDYNINMFVGGDYAINQHFDQPSDTFEIIVPHEDLLSFISSYVATEIFETKLITKDQFYEIEVDEYIIKFQSGSLKSFMRNEEVLAFLQSIQLSNSVFNNNVYGREFTFQTILYDLKDNRYIDPLGAAIDDLKDKRIKSVLPPALLLKYSPLSILNAIKFSVKYDMFIERELKILVKENMRNLHNFMSRNRLRDNFISMLDIDEERLIKTMEDYNINLIPEDIKDNYEKTITE